MPLVTGQTTLGAGATQLRTAQQPVTYLYITAPAGAIKIGKSDVATGGQVSLAGAASLAIGGTQTVFDLTEVWFTGTNAQVINWLAVAL